MTLIDFTRRSTGVAGDMGYDHTHPHLSVLGDTGLWTFTIPNYTTRMQIFFNNFKQLLPENRNGICARPGSEGEQHRLICRVDTPAQQNGKLIIRPAAD